MTTDQDNNRSSALSPEAIAMINTTAASAVQSAVEAVFKQLGPMLKEMAITPEKLREANRPWQDPDKVKRELRESLKSKEDEAEARKAIAALRANCPHVDQNSRTSIRLVHNQPDHQPRGICVLCGDWIHPKEWRIGAPDEKNPRGKAYLTGPHKDYNTVMQLERTS